MPKCNLRMHAYPLGTLQALETLKVSTRLNMCEQKGTRGDQQQSSAVTRACEYYLVIVTKLLPRNRSTVHIVRRGQPGAMLVSERQRQSSEEGRPSLQVIRHRREKPHARHTARPD